MASSWTVIDVGEPNSCGQCQSWAVGLDCVKKEAEPGM